MLIEELPIAAVTRGLQRVRNQILLVSALLAHRTYVVNAILRADAELADLVVTLQFLVSNDGVYFETVGTQT